MKSYRTRKIDECPKCGKPMEIIEYNNIDIILSPRDLESKYSAKKKGWHLKIPAHIDIECECMLCDFKSHESRDINNQQTIILNGRLL